MTNILHQSKYLTELGIKEVPTIFTERTDTTSWPQLLKVSYSGRGTQVLATSSELWQEKNTHGWKGAIFADSAEDWRGSCWVWWHLRQVFRTLDTNSSLTPIFENDMQKDRLPALYDSPEYSATLTSPDESQSCSSTKHISVSTPACSLVNRPRSTPRICSQQPFPPSRLFPLYLTQHIQISKFFLSMSSLWICSPAFFLVLRQHLVVIHQPVVICSTYMAFFQIYHKFLLKHLTCELRVHVC